MKSKPKKSLQETVKAAIACAMGGKAVYHRVSSGHLRLVHDVKVGLVVFYSDGTQGIAEPQDLVGVDYKPIQ